MPVLGPPVQPPAFRPLQTTPTPPPAPSLAGQGPDSLRRPGTAFGLDAIFRQGSTQPYEPPAWAKVLQVPDPRFGSATVGAGAQADGGYKRPGFPERITVDPFADDFVGRLLGGDLGVAMGVAPGGQRGGSYRGIATTPLTLANMSTWGRERVFALLTSLAGMDLQQPEGATFGPDAQPQVQGDGLLEGVVRGLQGVGNLVFEAFDAPMKWYRDSNAFNRGKGVRDLFADGSVSLDYIGTEMLTTAIFGGKERYSMEEIQRIASQQGVDPIAIIAKKWDLDPGIVAAIAANPFLSDQELGALTDGSPLSTDALSNLLLEGGMMAASLAVGGAGLAKGAAMLARAGTAPGAFASGLRGVGLAEGAGRAAQAARLGGLATRRMLQLNSWNTTAGWTIGAAEWGIKQYAIIAGDDALVAAMDRLMWQMPLSMNPGWNMIDGFSSHPIEAVRNLRRGQVQVGRPTSPGYVGRIDIPGMALRDATGETMQVRAAGRIISVGRNDPVSQALIHLRDLTPDELHTRFFDRLGWSRQHMEQAFGAGNKYDLTWDDARNALFHVALVAVREAKGGVGSLEGIHLPTMALRTEAFIRDNAKGALRTLIDNMDGKSTSMIDLFKNEFWDLAARNDSSLARTKAALGPWDPSTSFLDFLSWTRASKTVRTAYERGLVAKGATPTFRRTLNREFIGRWLARLEQDFGLDDIVPLSVVNQLKRYGGAVEDRGKGSRLIRGRQASYTRRDLEAILDDVLAEDDRFQHQANAVPREQTAAYNKGMNPDIDPLEDARVLGIGPTQLSILDRARQAPATTALPPRLAQIVAREMGITVDQLRAGGPEEAWRQVIEWADAKKAAAVDSAAIRDGLDSFAQEVRAQVADGRMDATVAAPIVAGLGRIRDELLSPFDPKVQRTRPGLYLHWQETATEAGVLVQEIGRHLDPKQHPEARWRLVRMPDGNGRLLPSAVSADLVVRYQALVDRVLKSGALDALSDFERQRLEDPLVHPFLKGDSIRAIASPADVKALTELEHALGGDPADLLAAMAGDAGLDPADLRGAVEAMTQQATAHVAAGLDLGSRAAQLARRFQSLGGAYSDELTDTMDRVLAADAVLRKAPGKRVAVTAVPMNPAANAARLAATERAAAVRALTEAEAALEKARLAARGATEAPSGFDEATMQWNRRRVFSKGVFAKRRDEALAEATRLQREEGAITRVVMRETDKAFEVEVAGPKAPEAPPIEAPVQRVESVDAVQRDIDVYLATNIADRELGTRGMDLEGDLSPVALADPRQDPAVIAPIEAMLLRTRERVLADLDANPAADVSRDPRIAVAAWADDRLAAIARGRAARETPTQSALEEAAVAPDAPPDIAAARDEGRVEMGGTPESGGATIAEPGAPRTQGGRIDLDAMRAQAEAEVAQQRRPYAYSPLEAEVSGRPMPPGFNNLRQDGTFPDPGTDRPIAYELRVVSASSLVTSSDPGFDAALQPRMRGVRQASDEQIASIAQSPDPARLLGTETGAQGTPVILPDGQVLAGNGRVTGIRQAHAQGTAGRYAAALDAAQAAGITDPVLVRVIDVPREEAIRLAVQLNFETGMPLADQALGLSRLLTAEDIQKLRIGASQGIEDALDSGANDAFVAAFLEHVPQQFRGTLKEVDGSLNQQGKQLMAATLLSRFTNASESPAGQLLIATMFEGDPEVRSLASGMDAIGALIQAQIESVDRPWGGVTPAFAADLVPALQQVFALQREMGNLRDVRASLMTVSMFDDMALTDAQRVLAGNLALMAQQGGGGGAAGLRRLLRNVARRVRGHEEAGVEAQPMDLFGADVLPDPSYPGVVNEAFTAMNLTRPEGSHFQLLPDTDGVTRVRTRGGEQTAAIRPVAQDPAPTIEALTPDLADVVLAGDDWAAMAQQAQRATGRIVISTATEAEADALGAFLSGEGPALPRRYRVVDGEIQPLGDIRGEIVERIYGRYRNEDRQREGARYLNWLLTQEGPEPPVAANVRKFVDSELAFRRGPRAVPTSEGLPALKAALAGRDFEVRVGREMADPEASAARPPEIVTGTQRDIDPDYEATTGLSPEVPEVDDAAREAQAARVHRIVDTADELVERAAQRAAGAPVVRGWNVIEIGAPDAAARQALADQRLSAAEQAAASARARLDALPPAPDGPVADVLSGSELDLYHRYTAASTTGELWDRTGRQPATVGEVVDLLQSLDMGMPPLVGTMTEAEMEALRGALLRVLHSRLDELGAGPDTGAAKRAGAGASRAREAVEGGPGIRVDEPPRMTTPEDFTADLAEVMRTLQGRVYEAADDLDGWEGTQYEIGMMPTKSRTGGPLAPRIPATEDWVARMDDLIPGLGDELQSGRKRAWAPREQDARFTGWLRHTPAGWMMARLRSMGDTAFGARPERDIVRQSIGRFTDELIQHVDGDAAAIEDAIAGVNRMIGAVHDGMADATMTFAKLPRYRRMGLVPPDRFDQWALKAFDGDVPEWLTRYITEQQAKGIKHPLAEAWREADNRIRAHFSKQEGGLGKYLDTLYGGRAGRTAHDLGRNLTVGYHTFRFLMDIRWLGLEAIEAPTLTLFREGPGAVIEAMGKGPNKGRMPLFMGQDAAETMRSQYAWWLAQSDPGALLRTRERYIFAVVRRTQEQEFPRALMEAARRSPDIMEAIRRFDGGEPMAWLRSLDADWEMAASRGRALDEATAKRLFTPWLERKVISQQEYDEFLRAGRWTGHPGIEAEIARVADPRLVPLLERLAAINEQGWNDAARLVFGQTDRSNVQRLMNHPLLWWPISYQIKAAKWLGGLLFDRAFGVDTGSLGAVGLGMLHEQHKERMRTDPEYARTIVENPTLLFFAQMLFPIAPWDMGVGLSPFTRLAIAAVTSDSPDEGYRRNIFSVGPGYTYYSMLPRLFYEQSKPDALAQGMGIVGDIMEAGQRFAPYSIPVKPTTSQLGSVEREVGQGATPTPEQPFPVQPRY